MPRNALIGTRIRARRTTLGLRQADLARLAGISASYLNLIEHNRRKVGPVLLEALAGALGLETGVLSEGAEAALLDDLRAAATRAGGAPVPELDRVEEFIGRFPGWAELLVAVHRRTGTLERTVEELSDRMTHDPYLSTALHEIVSAVTAVQSTAAILAETEDIAPEWRQKFHQNVHADAVRLADGAEALVNYLDASDEAATGLASPQEEAEAWLMRHDYHFPDLERNPHQPLAPLLADQVELASHAGQALAHVHLASYRDDVLALPLEPFLDALAELGCAPDRLAARFGVGLAPVFRRLAGLPKAAPVPVPGLVICDGSGTLTFRRPVEGFGLPRFGGACPLWPLYQVLARPGQPMRLPIATASRQTRRFIAHAFCQPRGEASFDRPQVWEAMMLLEPEGEAPLKPALQVGTSCRICPLGDCPARREPSILARMGGENDTG